MQFEKREYKKFNKNDYNSFILGGDVGGTNTNLGVFGVKNNFPALLLSFHFKTKMLKRLSYAVNEALAYLQKNYKIKITKACIAVAGVISSKRDHAVTQNVSWNISKKELLKKTRLNDVVLINDFEAVGYGINMLRNNDIILIKKAQKIPKAPIVVIGAGTGLGKTTLIYNEHFESYSPLPSEAGHSDFPAQSKEDLDLINFIKKHRKIKASVPYEGVLSGRGLENIYLFLRKNKKFPTTKYTKEIDKSKNNPELISKYRKIDKTCNEVFRIFKIIYARFARNIAIDSIARGGVYIAGGIAPKNRDIFDMEFVKAFEDNYKLAYLLKKMPIYLITNYDVGLLGSGFAGAKSLK